uniref:Uncharacterized protein n=1 Tax=Rhizophora mucronata TaxID=61149 RepID=A0A2P2P0H4_RHIMU
MKVADENCQQVLFVQAISLCVKYICLLNINRLVILKSTFHFRSYC